MLADALMRPGGVDKLLVLAQNIGQMAKGQNDNSVEAFFAYRAQTNRVSKRDFSWMCPISTLGAFLSCGHEQ